MKINKLELRIGKMYIDSEGCVWTVSETGELVNNNTYVFIKEFYSSEDLQSIDFKPIVKFNNKIYVELDFKLGGDIDEAVLKLLSYTGLAYINFNDHIMYSDTVTMDSAYTEITGINKKEFDKMQKDGIEIRRKEEIEFNKSIPTLISYYIKKGEEILSKDKLEQWKKIVPERLNDLYNGTELDNTLDIIRILKEDSSLEKAKLEIESQGHSGMSFSLVKKMIETFYDNSKEFIDYIDNL